MNMRNKSQPIFSNVIESTIVLTGIMWFCLVNFAHGSVSGKVIDNAEQSISGVSVKLLNANLSTMTDIDGNWSIGSTSNVQAVPKIDRFTRVSNHLRIENRRISLMLGERSIQGALKFGGKNVISEVGPKLNRVFQSEQDTLVYSIGSKILLKDTITSLSREGMIRKLDSSFNPLIIYGYLYDSLGKVYRTAKIGSEVWMAENFSTKTLKSFHSEKAIQYGGYYNWIDGAGIADSCWIRLCNIPNTKMQKGVCPIGWHIPTVSEWMSLEKFVKFNSKIPNVQTKRILGSRSWDISNVDEFGFRALPGGYGVPVTRTDPQSTIFLNLDTSSVWLSSSESSYNANYTASIADSFAITTIRKSNSANIRCVKDDSLVFDSISSIGSHALSLYTRPGFLMPSFSPNVLSYVDSIEENTDSIAVYVTPEDSLSKVLFNGQTRNVVSLNRFDPTVVSVSITNPNNFTTDYKLQIYRKSTKDSMVDVRDGKKYRTVRIGTKTWMAQNLNYKTSYSVFCKNTKDSAEKYGSLYNWSDAVNLQQSCNGLSCSDQLRTNHQGSCPNGWHIATYNEWLDLFEYLEGDPRVGKGNGSNAIKPRELWGYGNDYYGFYLQPAGCFSSGDHYCYVGKNGDAYLWAGTESNLGSGVLVWMQDHFSQSLTMDTKVTYYSVRCIKNP